MKTHFYDSFIKDMSKLTDVRLRERIKKAINNVETAGNIYEIPQLEKLVGYRTAFRVRVGNYRLGVFIDDDVVSFKCVQHRSKVYKDFPE